MEDLTDKQKLIFDYIKEYQINNGKSPTYNEIKEHFDFSSLNSVFKHINALESKKYITRSNQARGIDLVNEVKEKLFGDNDSNEKTLPLYGQIPAGNPTTTEGNVVDQISVLDYIVKDFNDKFLLTVKGDSVDKSGILEGDLVVVDQKIPPRNFDIVVALVDGENTLKQYTLDKNRVPHLMPFSNNPLHQEVVPVSECFIQGVVVSSMRKY